MGGGIGKDELLSMAISIGFRLRIVDLTLCNEVDRVEGLESQLVDRPASARRTLRFRAALLTAGN